MRTSESEGGRRARRWSRREAGRGGAPGGVACPRPLRRSLAAAARGGAHRGERPGSGVRGDCAGAGGGRMGERASAFSLPRGLSRQGHGCPTAPRARRGGRAQPRLRGCCAKARRHGQGGAASLERAGRWWPHAPSPAGARERAARAAAAHRRAAAWQRAPAADAAAGGALRRCGGRGRGGGSGAPAGRVHVRHRQQQLGDQTRVQGQRVTSTRSRRVVRVRTKCKLTNKETKFAGPGLCQSTILVSLQSSRAHVESEGFKGRQCAPLTSHERGMLVFFFAPNCHSLRFSSVLPPCSRRRVVAPPPCRTWTLLGGWIGDW